MRLYLDLKDWITGLKALSGKDGFAHLSDDFMSIAHGAFDRTISAPLSESHFYETWVISSAEQRNQLARVMTYVSRRDAMAPLSSLWKQEMDQLLAARLPVDMAPQAVTPFGTGPMFALCGVEREYESASSEADAAFVDHLIIAEPDRSVLSDEQRSWIAEWEAWAARHTELATEFASRAHLHNPFDRAAAAVFAILGDQFIGRAIVMGVPREFLALWRSEGSWALAKEMPSLGTFAELLRIRMPNLNRPWHRNDLHDLRYLCVALAYCDRVSCDAWWADIARRSNYICERGTTIISGAESLSAMAEGF